LAIDTAVQQKADIEPKKLVAKGKPVGEAWERKKLQKQFLTDGEGWRRYRDGLERRKRSARPFEKLF